MEFCCVHAHCIFTDELFFFFFRSALMQAKVMSKILLNVYSTKFTLVHRTFFFFFKNRNMYPLNSKALIDVFLIAAIYLATALTQLSILAVSVPSVFLPHHIKKQT